MKRIKLSIQDIVPFIAFFVIFVFFSIASSGRMLTAFNLNLLLDHSMQTIVVSCGTIFVIAHGSIDLSVGVNVALSGVIATWAAHATGVPFLLLPVALLVGLLVGLFNGVVVSKFKVPSFMLTIAMLIGVRGVVNYIQTIIGVQSIPSSLSFINKPFVKIPAFVIIVLVMAYVYEFTKTGRYSKAIGENETATRFVGVPITKMKIIVFALSGLMAGFGAIFSIATIGGTSMQMGVFLEMKVVMAIFLGGVLVTGGSSAKFYKILLGSFSIQIIVNGLSLIGKSESQISESVQGSLLLIILFVTILAGKRDRRVSAKELSDESENSPIAAAASLDEKNAE